MTNAAIAEELEWQEHRGKDNWQGSEKRPTMYRQHGHQDGFRCGKTNTHCEHVGRAGYAWVDYRQQLCCTKRRTGKDGRLSKPWRAEFKFTECIRQGSVESNWQNKSCGMESKAGRRKRWVSILTRVTVRVTTCEVVWTDNCWVMSRSKRHLQQMMKD